MNRTFTPPLGPAVLERLEAYADRFRPHFNRTRQAHWAEELLDQALAEGWPGRVVVDAGYGERRHARAEALEQRSLGVKLRQAHH